MPFFSAGGNLLPRVHLVKKCFSTSTNRRMVSLKEKKIGIIGMGNVGAAVATNLIAKNYKVEIVMDKDQSACSRFKQCQVAKTPQEVTEKSDIVISALPMPKHVKEVFAGTSGILSGLCSEKIWIDHSTTDYNQMMSFNEQVAAKGAFAIEAPITGGLEALKKGQMTVLMAGNEQKVAEVKPLMTASFQTAIYTGEFGTATIPKVMSNMLTVVNIIALGEVMMIAKRAGLDLKVFWDCIRASAGNSFVWETGGPMVMQGTYDPSFTIELQSKDNQLGYDMAKKYGVPIELMGHAQQILNRAQYTYGDDAPCYSAPRMLEEALKTSLRCEDFKDWSYSIQDVDGSSNIRHHGIKLNQDD